jgi:hypothetical protein
LLRAALFGACQMLAGAPEIILFTWIVTGIFVTERYVARRRVHATSPLRVLTVVLVITGLSAAQLLPFFELLNHSQRNTSFADAGWAMPATGWANFLVPLFRTFKSNRGVYFQYDQYWTSSYYVGIGTVALALYAAWKLRERRVLALAGIILVSLVLALGDAGYLLRGVRLLLPQAGLMRYPIKFVVLAVFAFPLLAAFAVNDWLELKRDLASRAWRKIKCLWFIVFGLVVAVVCFARFYPLDESWTIAGLSGATRMGLLTLILGTVWLLRRMIGRRMSLFPRLALLALLFLDPLTHTVRQNPTIERTIMEPVPLTSRNLDPLPRHGESRAMLTPQADHILRLTAAADPRHDYSVNRLGLFSNCNLLEGIPKIKGFFSLYLRETDALLSLIYERGDDPLPALYDFLSVSQITKSGEYYEWQRRPDHLPMVTSGVKPVFADANTTLNALSHTNFNPREYVYLPLESKSLLLATNRSAAKISESRFSTHRVDIQVEASAPSLVVISQAYYDPWHAYVDGQRRRIFRANYAFQAVQVPAGHHSVRLIYEDHAFRCGIVISFLALAICLPVWLSTGLRTEPLDPISIER